MNRSDLAFQHNPLFTGIARHELATLFICLIAQKKILDSDSGEIARELERACGKAGILL